MVETAQLWWRLIVARVTQVQGTLPPALKGTIQVVLTGPSGEVSRSFLRLDRRGAALGVGAAEHADAVIEIDDQGAQGLLRGGPEARGQLAVRGDRALVQAFFSALAKAPAPTSWLGIRSPHGPNEASHHRRRRPDPATGWD
ncbi:MAG: hypothetical protein IT384_28285 [Deltaproteobacteria bacterium]|nr:hypothetical protein [Deltaproteobacteria bacterium]